MVLDFVSIFVGKVAGPYEYRELHHQEHSDYAEEEYSVRSPPQIDKPYTVNINGTEFPVEPSKHTGPTRSGSKDRESHGKHYHNQNADRKLSDILVIDKAESNKEGDHQKQSLHILNFQTYGYAPVANAPFSAEITYFFASEARPHVSATIATNRKKAAPHSKPV